MNPSSGKCDGPDLEWVEPVPLREAPSPLQPHDVDVRDPSVTAKEPAPPLAIRPATPGAGAAAVVVALVAVVATPVAIAAVVA
jgi:hypothetical protein